MMQLLVNAVDKIAKEKVLVAPDKLLDLNDERTGDIWWEELEIVCRELKLLYYKENEINN